jgi:hypothetical protein
MADQPTAMRLADDLEIDYVGEVVAYKAAAELRRLHEAHEWQYKMAGDRLRRIEKLEKVNQEVLEVLKQALEECIWPNERLSDAHAKARAAIAKAEGEKP